ncbi:MAG: SDR family oxidoreductase [Cucumibacter sp.]
MADENLAIYKSLDKIPVIISGGATGIGATLVSTFASQGSKVGFVDIAAAAGTALADRLSGEGRTVKFIECDITDIPAYRAAVAEFAKVNGPALVLINNAAFDGRHDWREVTPEFWDARMAVNLKHAYFAIQAVAPAMIEAGRGSIINLGSISWMTMLDELTIYEPAKAAAHGLTRAFARTLGGHGVRINTIVPGWVMTPRQLEFWVGPDEEKLIGATQALKGRVYPEDVARMALFLAAEDSRMISAQQFLVDGGWANT